MCRTRSPILPAAALAAWLLLLGAGCSRPAEAPAASGPAAEPPASAAARVTLDASALEGPVALAEVRLGRLPELLRVSGRIGLDEDRTVSVGAIVEGRVTAVHANVGDSVRAGQRLAELHSQKVHETRAAYARAYAELEQRQAELAFAAGQRDRTRRLLELKAASPEQLQRAETDVTLAEKSIVMARTEIGRLEEELRQMGVSATGARDEYSHAEPAARAVEAGEYEAEELVPVTAPIGGTILKRLVGPGTVVTPALDLFVIADLSRLWVIAQVPEKYLSRLRPGQSATVTVQAYGGTEFPARIERLGDVLDPETRTVQVRCVADNTDRRLKPEMYATVSVGLGEGAEALLVPAGAIQDVDGVPMVFVRESGGRFRACAVRPGRRVGDWTEVAGGVRSGDQVADRGSFLVKSELLKSRMAEE